MRFPAKPQMGELFVDACAIYCAKTQSLLLFTRFCASFRFRRPPPASVGIRILPRACRGCAKSPHAFPPRNHPQGAGELFVGGRVGYLRKNAISSEAYAFCASANFRQLPSESVGYRNFRCFVAGESPRPSAEKIAAITPY